MFEVVKLILDALKTVFNPSEFLKLRNERKLNEIGASLYLLYIHLNEILICGESILRYLEGFKEQSEKKLAEGKEDFIWIPFPANTYRLSSFSFIVAEQRINLAKFGIAVALLDKEFQVIDPNSYRKLRHLICQKQNSLHSLLSAMGKGYLPLRDLQASTKYELWSSSSEEELKKDAVISFHPDVVWDKVTYLKIKDYFESCNPYEHIKEIEQILNEFRTSLEATFTIKDILLKVKDKRLTADQYDGAQFVYFSNSPRLKKIEMIEMYRSLGYIIDEQEDEDTEPPI